MNHDQQAGALNRQSQARQTAGVPKTSQEQPTWRRRRLGTRLRAQRGERRAIDVANAMGKGWSDSKISRIENGVSSVSVPDVRKLLRLYDTTAPDFDELVKLARHTQQVGWWHDYRSVLPRDFGSFAELESDATSISAYEETLIPGLFQSEDYALEIMQAGRLQDSDEEIGQRLEARMARRELFETDAPPRLTSVIGETALRLSAGGPRVMKGQLRQLLDDGERDHVSVHVVPNSAGPHAATGFPFTVFELPGGVAPVVYSEQLRSSRYDEDPDAVAEYRLAFNAVRARALSPTDSAALMAQIMKEQDR